MVAATIESATTTRATGFPGRTRSPSTSSPIATTPTGEHKVIRLAELTDNHHKSFKKISPATCHAQKTWQLGHTNGQGCASLEADKNTITDQLHERAKSQQPGEQGKSGHREGRKAGNLCIVLHVTIRHCSHRCGNHKGDGGSGSDRKLT